MSGHTLGPWLVCEGPLNYQHRIYSSDGGWTVCDVVKSRDARLIAAAPDLLDVALMLAACAEQVEEGDTFVDVRLESPLMHAARAAIAAATGETT